MRITHSQIEHFSHVFRWFSAAPMAPEGVRKDAAIHLNAIDSPKKSERVYALRALGLLCFLALGEEGDLSRRLLRLFEHYAQFSEFEDVRFGCIDAIYLARDFPRLVSLHFESGCLPTDYYRERLASALHTELYPSMKC
jgi:hypothetical protein